MTRTQQRARPLRAYGSSRWPTRVSRRRPHPSSPSSARRGYEPAGYTLYAYAVVQVWAQAVEKAGTFDAAAGCEGLAPQ